MSYGKNLILSIVCLLIIAPIATAQTERLTLDQQFKDVIENTESFKQYKVVPKTTLNGLFKQIGDSLAKEKIRITALENEVSAQKALTENSLAELSQVKTDLEQSNTMNDSIGFMGASFQKSVYNIIVWGLIILLAVAAGFIYMLFKRSHKITRSTQNDLKRLSSEFDDHKTKAHEKQVKLKRDLQTAMNTLHEKGIKV